MTTKTTIKAGGGVVINPENQILMIFRRNHWDLPKGKIEMGESIEQCALREVQEECGIENLVIGEFLCVTRHQYEQDGVSLVKESHWFMMQGSGEPTPQGEEDITIARWVCRDELPLLLQDTYPTIREVLDRVTTILGV